MSGCNDPWEHERDGKESARFGRRYDFEHEEKMRRAEYGSLDSCEAHYAYGYRREIERREEERREEEREQERQERRHQERLEWERCQEEQQDEREQENLSEG